LSTREAKEFVPDEMHPLKSSLAPRSVKFPQLPDHIHRRVSDPPPQELMDKLPFVVGVNLYQLEPVAPGCEAPVPVIIDAVNVPGDTLVANTQLAPWDNE
jgi:hypothetical protein